MAIQQFGESLLSDVRKRNKQEAKRLRKEEEKQALLGLGVSIAGTIGNKMLASKVDNFMASAPFLQKNLTIKNNISEAMQITEAAKNYEKEGSIYFYNQGLSKAAEKVDYLQANANLGFEVSASQKQAMIHALAKEYEKEQEERIKALGKSAEELTQLSYANPKAYEESVRKNFPKNWAELGVKKIVGFLGGDADSTIDNVYTSRLAETSTAFQSLRESLPPLKAMDLFENQNIDWQRAPLKVERDTIEVPDNFTGQTYEQNVERIIGPNNRTIAMYIEGTDTPVNIPALGRQKGLKGNQGFNETYRNNTIEVVRQVASSKDREVLENYANKILIKNEENPTEKELALNNIYGTIYSTTNAIQSRISMDEEGTEIVPTKLAVQVATKMQALNIEHTTKDTNPWYKVANKEQLPGLDLYLTEDGYSPFLALAAIEELEKENKEGTRTRFNEDSLARLKLSVLREFQSSEGRIEIQRAFETMSDASQKNYLDWMSNYDIFSKRLGDQPAFVDVLKTLYSPTVILEKDKNQY